MSILARGGSFVIIGCTDMVIIGIGLGIVERNQDCARLSDNWFSDTGDSCDRPLALKAD